jgi:U3 small nucleolar RNA-associated protein 4
LFELRPGASEGEEWTLRKQDSPEGGVSCAHLLLFTPDGKVLVAVGASGAVNVIDLESWEVMEVLKQHLPKPSLAAKALAAKGNRAKASLGGKDDDGGKTAVAVSSGGGPPTRMSPPARSPPRTSGAPRCRTRARARTGSGWRS